MRESFKENGKDTYDPEDFPFRRARELVRQRRSAVAMDGMTHMDQAEFFKVLCQLMPEYNPRLFNLASELNRVQLGLFIHRVEGLTPGLYLLVRNKDKLSELQKVMDQSFLWRPIDDCPLELDLYCLQEADLRELARRLSCDQPIASQGVFSCAMLAEFEAPIHHEGAWYYRKLFWECGLIGQQLYLEAELRGLQGTGIGCFFDDPVHQVFGLEGFGYQSLYHFTLGRGLDDPRLQTYPAYYFLDSTEAGD
ncbi:nitroreductase family protein [Dongshaea marina]|uniref:nitroreductase family protein n=1 Tax=Dongshaea marina TaxID=2047966 RepID=UPI000D3E0806|nr:nitroreductase family protein [Dongshaea marina]